MNDQYVRNVIEAALLASGRPLTTDDLVSLFDERDGSGDEAVQGALSALRAEYEGRGIEIVEVASGFRVQVRSSVAQPVSRLWREWRPASRSRAARSSRSAACRRSRTSSRRCWSAVGSG